MPKTAVTGCMTDSFEEKDVEVGVLLVAIAATGLLQSCLAQSMLFWVRYLYEVGFGKSFGQLTTWWSTKNFLHLMQPSLSLKIYIQNPVVSGTVCRGRCRCGCDIQNVTVVVVRESTR